MKVQALVSFTYKDNVLSMYAGEIADVDSTIGADLISEGYVKEYSEGGGIGTPISVTLVSTNQERSFSFYTYKYDEELNMNIVTCLVPIDSTHYAQELHLEGERNETRDIILLSDDLIVHCGFGDTVVTGNATASFDSELGYDVSVTGDCTITLS